MNFAYISSLKFPWDWMLNSLKIPFKICFSPKTKKTIPSKTFTLTITKKTLWIQSCFHISISVLKNTDKNPNWKRITEAEIYIPGNTSSGHS